MGRTDKKENGSQGSVKLQMGGIPVDAGFSEEDTYRAIIWNLVLKVKNTDSLRYILNTAATYYDRETNGIYEFQPDYIKVFATKDEIAEELKQYLLG